MSKLLYGTVYFIMIRLVGIVSLVFFYDTQISNFLLLTGGAAVFMGLVMLFLEYRDKTGSVLYAAYFLVNIILTLANLVYMKLQFFPKASWYEQFITGNIPDLLIASGLLIAAICQKRSQKIITSTNNS